MEWTIIVITLCLVAFGVIAWYKLSLDDLTAQQKKEAKKLQKYARAEQALKEGNLDYAFEQFQELSGFSQADKMARKTKETMLDNVRHLDTIYNDLVIEVEKLTGCRPSEHFDMEAIDSRISEAETILASSSKLAQELGRDITEYNVRLNQIKALGKQASRYSTELSKIAPSYMMPSPVLSYGKAEPSFIQEIEAINSSVAVTLIDLETESEKKKDYDALLKVRPSEIIKACWKIAMTKPYSARIHDLAMKTLSKRLRVKSTVNHLDSTLSKLYAQFSIGGEDAVCEVLRDKLGTEDMGKERCAYLASFFMWIGASRAETIVLEFMLANGIEMTPKMQERLHTLKKSGSKTGTTYSVRSNDALLFFDTSSVDWDEDNLEGFFSELAFREEDLGYSLAFRDDEKSLIVPSGMVVPTTSQLEEGISRMMREEFGNDVVVSEKECVALSGKSKERISAMLIKTHACDRMSILVFLVPVGKKLAIKQYTLYMPTGKPIADQKEDARSLLSQISPMTKIWENSLKQAVLSSIEKILNGNSGVLEEKEIKGKASQDIVF